MSEVLRIRKKLVSRYCTYVNRKVPVYYAPSLTTEEGTTWGEYADEVNWRGWKPTQLCIVTAKCERSWATLLTRPKIWDNQISEKGIWKERTKWFWYKYDIQLNWNTYTFHHRFYYTYIRCPCRFVSLLVCLSNELSLNKFSVSRGGEYENDCLLKWCSGKSLLTFQRCFLHPTSFLNYTVCHKIDYYLKLKLRYPNNKTHSKFCCCSNVQLFCHKQFFSGSYVKHLSYVLRTLYQFPNPVCAACSRTWLFIVLIPAFQKYPQSSIGS
jgi:hypothetical protein